MSGDTVLISLASNGNLSRTELMFQVVSFMMSEGSALSDPHLQVRQPIDMTNQLITFYHG